MLIMTISMPLITETIKESVKYDIKNEHISDQIVNQGGNLIMQPQLMVESIIGSMTAD